MHHKNLIFFALFLMLPNLLRASIAADGAIYMLIALGATCVVLPAIKYVIVNNLFGIKSKKLYIFYLIGLAEGVTALLIFDLLRFDDVVLAALYLLSAFVINLLYFPRDQYRLEFNFVLRVLFLMIATPLFIFGALSLIAFLTI